MSDKKHGENIIFWGILNKTPTEESKLPDELILTLTQMESELQKQNNIILIQNLYMASINS